MIRNKHWFNLNASRAYPLDTRATGKTDGGVFLPHPIIVDLNMVFPLTLGRYAFLGAVAVTEQVVSVTIQAADAPDAVSDLKPLAVITVQQPIVVGRQYPLEAQADGVGGWISFGDGVVDNQGFSGRFSSPAQSLLTNRAARAIRGLPVTSVGSVLSATPLTGLVRLRSVAPLEIVKESREINGVARDVAVFRLVQPATQTTNIFEEFSGGCSARPESGNCGDPQPIEFVGAVSPDCDGIITIEFQGCVTLSRLYDTDLADYAIDLGAPAVSQAFPGAVIECDLGLVDVCIREARLPDDDGKLPDEYADLCPEPTPTEDEECDNPFVPDSISTPEGSGSLPYLDNFDDYLAVGFQRQMGGWTFYADDSPTELLQANPAAPVITGPTNPTADTTPTIDWTSVSGAVTYELWVNNLSTGGTKVIYETGLTSSEYTSPTAMDPGDYECWVRAYGVQNSRSAWSSRYEFTISGTPVSLPDPETPEQPTNSAIPEVDVSLSTTHALSLGGRNVTVWNSFDNTSLKRRVTTHLQMLPGPNGSRHNGGIVLNYRGANELASSLPNYLIAEIDYDELVLRLTRFNGQVATVLDAVAVPELGLNRWYQLVVSTGAIFFGKVSVRITLQNVTGPSLSKTLGPYLVDDFGGDGTGLLGFGTNRAQTLFSFFYVEQLP